MLAFLRVRDLAVLRDVEVSLGPGLNVLTGETGAGKSLLVDAVALIMGERADAELIRRGESVASVEGQFTGLDEDEVPNGTAVEGANDFGRVGYGGPCPPRGRGAHRYQFHLYALAQPLKLERGFTRRDFEKALRGHVLATAVLQGTCERRA